MSTTLQFDAPLSSVPHLDQLLGVWAIEPSMLASLTSALKTLNLGEHLAAQSMRDMEPPSYRVDQDGVAVISISGMMQKHAASFSTATSTVLVRREIRAAVADPTVGAILLHVESGGGTAAGTPELSDKIKSAAKRKPVFSHIEDI